MIRLLIESCLWLFAGIGIMAALFFVLSRVITTTYFSPGYALVYAALLWVVVQLIRRLTR